MRNAILLILLGIFFFQGKTADQPKSLFDRFTKSFDVVGLPFAIDENFMQDRYVNPEKFKKMDPIFFEYIFSETDKERILAECGGYEDIRSKIHHAFVGRVNLSPKFISLIYTETILNGEGDSTTYYLNTYSFDGFLISRMALAEFENIGTTALFEGYIFDMENVFKIKKVYDIPGEIQKLARFNIVINKKGEGVEIEG